MVEPGLARRRLHAGGCLDHLPQHHLRIAEQPDLHRIVAAELARVDPTRLGWLRTAVLAIQAGASMLLAIGLSWLYLELAPGVVALTVALGGGLAASGVLAYGLLRRRMPALEGHGVDPRAA
jgi:hypothetical protein